MASFMAIFAAGLAGYSHLGLWPIGIIAAALVMHSQAEFGHVYARAVERGYSAEARSTLLQSCFNALAAASAAYGAGVVFRLL